MGVLQAYSNQDTEHLGLRALIERIQTRPPKDSQDQPLPRRFPRLTADKSKAMAADYQAGMRVKELTVKYGVSRETVIRHLRRQAVGPRKLGLNEQQIKEAAKLYEQGDSLATIEKRMSVTAHTVRSRLIEAGVTMRSSYEHMLDAQQVAKDLDS